MPTVVMPTHGRDGRGRVVTHEDCARTDLRLRVCRQDACRRSPDERPGGSRNGGQDADGPDGLGAAAAATTAAAAVDRRRRPVQRRMVQHERVQYRRQVVLCRHRGGDTVERHDRVLHGHDAVLPERLPARHHVGHLFETRRHQRHARESRKAPRLRSQRRIFKFSGYSRDTTPETALVCLE